MQRRRTGKIIKWVLLSVFLLTTFLFVLNLYLTNRLEGYLKKELVERTSKATDGFYRLSFDDLSVSFFKGELKLEGVSLTPDSAVFRLWQSKDSLPDVYVSARIGMIGFKGLNLTWRLNYKRLHFQSFEIRSPEVQVNSSSSPDRRVKIEHPASKTLYEVISPYIDVLSVKTLNLENATVSYRVRNAITPITYALEDVSFHGYGFLLDSLSSTNGKLLYCDNFDFTTNRPQTLLTNNDFRLLTDRIVLSTSDSMIYIHDIRIVPQEKLWDERKQKPENYISAHVKNVQAKGVFFKREEALNYLSARSFEILSPDIKAFSRVTENVEKDKVSDNMNPINADSLVKALSLYDVVSPVLHSISIHRVSIQNARLDYSRSVKQFADVYRMNSFNFQGNDFQIDSLSIDKYDLGYFRSFSFQASDIDGRLPDENYYFRIGNMKLDTEFHRFQVDNIHIKPIFEKPRKDYISGQIDSISLDGLFYDKHRDSMILKLGVLHIAHPVILYKQYEKRKQEGGKRSYFNFRMEDLYTILGVFSNRLVIDTFSVSNGSLHYIYITHDRSEINEMIFPFDLKLSGVNIKDQAQTFDLSDIYFRTKNIRIPLDNGFYSLRVGDMQINNSRLTLDSLHLVSLYPKMEFAYKQPKHEDWFDVAIGNISLTGIDIPYYISHNRLQMESLQVNDVLLQNFKNKKIYVKPRIIPMIYSAIQKAPVQFAVTDVGVKNLTVIYEELEKKGTQPGKLYFTDMKGKFTGFTNIVSGRDQYIRLEAEGKLMGQGLFTATWKIPVDSLNDRFLLNARMDSFDLRLLNEIITPLASAEVKSGWTSGLVFSMDASSEGGEIEMVFPYRNFEVSLLTTKYGEVHSNAFLSGIANLVLRNDNPSHPEKSDSKLRYINMYVERDPYHSTFNYLWQMLRPAVAASVGVPKKEQDTIQRISTFFQKVKRFFEGEKHKREEAD